MTTASEEILARYKKSETETDAFGRVVTVRPLRPAQQLAILRMVNTDDQTNRVSFLILAGIRKIEDDDIPFPKTLGELEAVANRLDDEGLEAAGKAYRRLKGIPEDLGAATTDAEKEEIKNS